MTDEGQDEEASGCLKVFFAGDYVPDKRINARSLAWVRIFCGIAAVPFGLIAIAEVPPLRGLMVALIALGILMAGWQMVHLYLGRRK